MRVLFVTSEVLPLAKTGGLADVSRALPVALVRRGLDVRIVLPGYRDALERLETPRTVMRIEPLFGVTDGVLVSGKLPDSSLTVWLVCSPRLFDRGGGLYQDENGRDWFDNALRFLFFSQVAAKLAAGQLGVSWRPDVVHANDWHSGLLPLWLTRAAEPRPHILFTAHNLAFQGNFAPAVVPQIPDVIRSALEFHGQLSFLKAGLCYADRITTVSPTYACESLTPEFGCGMDGVLRQRGRDFVGILNGVDDELWNPATDSNLPQTYTAADVTGKRVCKCALQAELGLPVHPETPLVAFASRLTHQKMVDTLLDVIPWIAAQHAQLVILGEGDRAYEERLVEVRQNRSENLAVVVGYDEALAHRVHAGSDILLAPARFEPCGLVQLYALRYGTLPIVRRTGGLADTVVDATSTAIESRTATGFVFERPEAADLIEALGRALTLFREPLQWRLLQLQAMTRDFSWDASAAQYIALYKNLALEATVAQSVLEEKRRTTKRYVS